MRLIDADAFNDWILSHFAEPQSALILTLQGFIAEQPTAYSIDKVVEELEKESYTTTDTVCGGIFKAIRTTSAIEIVKQGGVSDDDVCEWKDKELYGYYTSCTEFRSRIACKDAYWKYCPYCGKKIKVVEGWRD